MYSAVCFIGMGVLSITLFLLKKARTMEGKRGIVFPLLYHIYANSRIGLWHHKRCLERCRRKYADAGGAHSDFITFKYESYQVLPVPILDDNYAYIIIDNRSMKVAVIDPGDFVAVENYLNSHQLQLDLIMITHKHWDHCGGVEELVKTYPLAKVFSNELESIRGTTHPVKHMDEIEIGDLLVKTYLTPGHTQGHMMYHILSPRPGDPDSLFTGDLLFIGGCGKVFEGTSEQLLRSLDFACTLPESALVWPGHEYTKDNLNFAAYLEPANVFVQERLKQSYDERSARCPTCPSRLGDEKTFNPFLRTHDNSFLQKVFAKEYGDADWSAEEAASSEPSISSSSTEKSQSSDMLPQCETKPIEQLRADALRHLRLRKDSTSYTV